MGGYSLVIALVLVVALLAVGAYFLFRPKDTTKDEATKATKAVKRMAKRDKLGAIRDRFR